ncbi:MAG: cytochrome c biogenesis protein CcsA [Prevotella sp.]|nr:cytochrome c biogenesis protein CcsA [Prevotella sp.]
MKKTVIALYIVVVVVMAAATIVEKYQGMEYAATHIYGSWWFCLLWGLLTVAAVYWLVKRRVRRWTVVMLHLSMVVILLGALLTHLTSRQGVVHLRTGADVNSYLTPDMQEHPLPFTITLQRFEVTYHEGTDAPSDYLSYVTINGQPYTISMNHIASCEGIRLYQSSYDEDLQGSVLALNQDPWGIPVTYVGYGLLLLSLIGILTDPHGTYRQLLRCAAASRRQALMAVMLLLSVAGNLSAAPRVLPPETADRFCRLFVVADDRVCPMETYALDFTRKLYGKNRYGDYSAAQVLTGFIFFYDDWMAELPTDGRKAESRRIAAASLHSGRPLKVFPYADDHRTVWYAPTDPLPESMSEQQQRYIREVFTRLNGEVQAGRYDVANAYLDKMLLYQQTFGGRSLPTEGRLWAERTYNKVPFATLLFMTCLTLGLLSFLLLVFPLRRGWMQKVQQVLQYCLLTVCLLVLTGCLVLRWMIVGHVPLTNGYETMLFMAWAVMVLTLALSLAAQRTLLLTFGFLLSGFFLLVSHISQMDPRISHLMPVLDSPLLSLHVSVIMTAYALLSLTFVVSLTALVRGKRGERAPSNLHEGRLLRRERSGEDELWLLSQLLLFPAVACLTIGIFVGAVWANVSWGTYWSWDPKETWALITLMVYAVPLHQRLRVPYHLYMTLAFLAVLITYFGVNYFLGGMHSYA